MKNIVLGCGRARVILALAVIGWTSLLATSDSAFSADDFEQIVMPYLQRHCVDCHGEETSEADRRFDGLTSSIESIESIESWRDILDQVSLGAMPPDDRPRPSEDETSAFVRWVEQRIVVAELEIEPPEPRLRRLNRREFNNTLRDLLAIDVRYDPSRNFPTDAVDGGFDTSSVSLISSPAYLTEVLAAAREAIDRAIDFGNQPDSNLRLFDLSDNAKPAFFNENEKYLMLATGAEDGFQRFTPRQRGSEPTLTRGEYLIRIRATGMFSDYEGPGEIDGPVQMRVRVGPGGDGTGRPRQTVKVFELQDDNVEVYEVRAWIESGDVPIVGFANGHDGSLKNLVRRRFGREARTNRRSLFPDWDAPHVRVFSVEVEGPLYDTWPPSSHQLIVGAHAEQTRDDAELILSKFVRRAFRHGNEVVDISPHLQIYDREITLGNSHEKAIEAALTAVLCDARFLYHRSIPTSSESESATARSRIASFVIANRMSYLLWSSLPDEELLESAASGELLFPEGRTRQTLRMLADPRSDALVSDFGGQWLTIDRLGEMPPDPKRFESYYQSDLETAMREETLSFLRYVLKQNLSVSTLLRPGFTFLNETLARHYGIDDVSGDVMQRIELPHDSVRGGLLGHASILTVTSNGTVTSPVVRGVWVLENLLGSPPPSPPDDVPAFEPDTRGSTTIREQLAKHREHVSCANCHQKIDPIGFALEHFDPIGAYRSTYEHRQPIETIGELPDGSRFDGVNSLRDLLLDRKKELATTLMEKLLVYATGRRLSLGDRHGFDRLMDEKYPNGEIGLRDLVLEVVASPMFVRP